jgi:hypothetical protein
LYINIRGTAIAQWLRYSATNQKVAGSIPYGVMEFFIRNEYQEYFLGINVAGT